MTRTELSPFELKNILISMATSHAERTMLNAGRGNPNFLATIPRHAYLLIGEFAIQEAERSYAYMHSGFGGKPEKEGILGRFDSFIDMRREHPGFELLTSALSFIDDHMGIAKADFLYEIVAAFLGCDYPFPPRMLRICEQIVKIYISKILCGTTTNAVNFDLFATEGGTAGMTYLFSSLSRNGLIDKGDKIAMITPIFSPYLEIPQIPEYDLTSVYIKADEDQKWQLPDKEIKKLEDPAIKILYLVNPSNPPSVKMSDSVLDKIADLIKRKRHDLMIVTDDVYATFSDNFISLFSKCPYNTLCVYSFSKYFGCTGWRLGVMALHNENIIDAKLKALPKTIKTRLARRYESLTDKPEALKFIDRLVADSRTVALNHTAGLSTPQQLQMTLFAMSQLVDESGKYQSAAKRLIRRRYEILYHAIGLQPEFDINSVDYYTIVDLEILAEQIYDAKFSKWLLNNLSGFGFLRRLADETSVVLLPGKGFEVDHPSARVSLANLTEDSYKRIGLSVRKILEEYYQDFEKI